MSHAALPDLSARHVDRFHANVMVTDTCHIWSGTLNKTGYGVMGIRQGAKTRGWLAHRVAYRIATGVDPADMVVRHRCDLPCCVAPYHLELGTQADNMADALARGRHSAGGKGGLSHKLGRGVLTSEAADHIRWLRAQGWSVSRIAPIFGISENYAYRVASGAKWKLQ